MAKTDGIPEDLKVYAVTESGKIYWAKRNARGQFVNAYGRNRADSVAADYAAYVEAEVAAAEFETKGNLVSLAGRRRGISVEEILTGRRSLRWATAELRDRILRRGLILRIRAFQAAAIA